MNVRSVLLAFVVLFSSAASFGQADRPADPVSGNWGSNGLVFLELKFDGKSDVSGTTIWRHGQDYESRAAIKTGMFDPKTSALKLEGEAKRPDGTVSDYVIEGKIDGDTVSGTFKFGVDGGEFTFKKMPATKESRRS